MHTDAVKSPERNTRQRDAIRQAMLVAQRPLSPQEILNTARDQGTIIGIATIYRNLKAFLEAGDIAPVTIPGESPRYEIAGRGHHHHFHCTTCDRVFDVYHCPGELREIAPRGFQVKHHELILYGVCADCAAPAAD